MSSWAAFGFGILAGLVLETAVIAFLIAQMLD